MSYHIKIRMTDEYGQDVYKSSGPAKKELNKAFSYLRNKQGGVLKGLLDYLEEDFKVLNDKTKRFEKIIFRKEEDD